MKFSNYLKSINQVGIYPMISLVLFMVVFIGVLIYMHRLDREKMDQRANIPLQ